MDLLQLMPYNKSHRQVIQMWKAQGNAVINTNNTEVKSQSFGS
jgi:hypothetical protein